ncbi:MAG: glycogen debranching protein GlgX [Pseudotabrizicola sp.]|uniref:glycogen debranching protein GlgX n=1 Tax=Pseudotabrizicola sp. TaxID=2939647 RepID=UPI0027317794|nr:glycogen debranching protein GlgX [Pseudotabrizicola sp.]MDP2082720.1 glycogen debranching protein GlgX [Pseudotabrizicola sp.]MDZ7576307.1 glycogen debranching protein GlgX [Pseudotabrizicola sp.]
MTPGLTPLPARLPGHAVSAGRPWPMGALLDGDGVNFAVFSAHAEMIELCLFSSDGRKEMVRLPFQERDGDIWHMHVGGLTPGTVYGYRAHGPYVPEQGHRFNPHKLLLDPYARALEGRLRWSDAVMGYKIGSPRGDLSFDTRDSAFAVPKAVVTDTSFTWGDDTAPRTPRSETVIYEAHVKALTQLHPGVDKPLRGSYLALASDPVIAHLQKLGVTAVELLPVQAFPDDRFLVAKGLRNHWGYNTLSFFAPEPRYMAKGALWEFQTMVRRLHSAGIEVILDVVYNHTAEGDQMGPTLSYRGLDNASYYRLADGGRYYVNDTGTGNTLNLTHPMVLRMVMDSLRYWVEVCHVDGFRFDLATVLGREPHGFDPNGGFFDAIRQDPVLSRVKLIAEPWDIGPGGYQLGQYPHPFHEWNDQFRDGVRRFWRGDAGLTPDLAKRLLGSAERFDHSGRSATSSVNFLTAHDGFTLEDLVSFTVKRNWDNGEDNRDGHSDNHSDNMGVEGPSDDPAVLAARALRKRNLAATLFLSQGVPMWLAGDELGHSQGGNNNAYAQDNAVTWLDWSKPDHALTDFVAHLAALRRAHPVLRQRRFLHARKRAADGLADVNWLKPDGTNPTPQDWHDPAFRALGVELRMAAEGHDPSCDAVLAYFNCGGAVPLTLPTSAKWALVMDTTRPDLTSGPAPAALPAQSVLMFRSTSDPGRTQGENQ